MTVIRGVGAISLGKCLGAFYALIGVTVGTLTSMAVLLGSPRTYAILGKGLHLGELGLGGGLLLMVGAVILYGLAGFVLGLITGALVNLALRLGGGVELELE
ncbi:hypothetical protein [Myxococcus fulvus]|uniref:hypothetical protein n=1 Tax=Myxococcus fulvus TaxID=33 RepID=UPI0020C18746|nr:hypothetical protein [Myxococcus fulvus]MCK8499059.1 hypothetical protein [Myxococcus fulvus]